MNRKGWIDALRALAIVLVVLGHQLRGITEYFIITSPVKMPLFFAISGYLFKMRDGDNAEFFKSIALKLIVPWFSLALIPEIPELFTIGGGNLLADLISGKKLWFMPCFVVGMVIHYLIRKLSKREMHVVVGCILIAGIGLVLHRYDILKYAMINRAMVVQVFFMLGYLFREHESWMLGRSWYTVSIMAILYIFFCALSFIIFPNKSLDVHLNRYYNIPYCMLLIGLGVLTLFTAAAKSSYSRKWTSIIGQNTLVLYIWHGYAISLFVAVLGTFHFTISVQWTYAIVKTVWAILICNICAYFINRYVPEIAGKRRN